MTKEQKRIYLDLWLSLHPYKKPAQSDYYYLDLCNRMMKIIGSSDHIGLISLLNQMEKETFCCFLVCYLEDIVSGAGIWQAFTRQHSELYGKVLPFYKPDEYFHAEINPEDIFFLVWYFLSTTFYDETIFSPVSEILFGLGKDIYKLLESEYEQAPENKRLNEFLAISPNEDDFFTIRRKISWIIMDSYLFHFNRRDYINEIADEINQKGEDFVKNHLPAFMYELNNSYSISGIYPLLALRGKDWLAHILGRDHPLFEDIMNISESKTGFYMYLKHENDCLYFQHIATDTILPVTIKSFGKMPDFDEGKSIMAGSFVKWKNEWWFSGITGTTSYNPDIINDEKKSTLSRSLFEGPVEKQHEEIQRQSKAFFKFNDGKPIAFFERTEEAGRFILNFFESYKSHLRIFPGAVNKVLQRSRKKEFPGLPKELNIPDEVKDIPGFVFFNHESGIEIAYGFNEVIPDTDNPLYDEEKSREGSMSLLTSPELSKECFIYLMENTSLRGLYFADESDETILKENLDFMLRYWKKEKYYSKPGVTII